MVNKDRNSLFNVTMGSFDSAEVCELVGLYLLNNIRPLLVPSNVGLFRGDGIAIIHKANGPKLDRLRKDLIRFKDEGLSITTDTNLTEKTEQCTSINTFKIQPSTVNYEAISINDYFKLTHFKLKNSGYQTTLKFWKPSQNTRQNPL